jgi:hypothetical protein
MDNVTKSKITREKKHITTETTKSGRIVYYYREKHGPRTRLNGTPGTLEFDASYELRATNYHDDITYKSRVLRVLLRRLKNARSRDNGKSSNLITSDWAKAQISKQQYRCYLTGIKFVTGDNSRRVNPYSPSIDRIDNSKGYEISNVRIVCFAVNMMMLDWGESVMKHVAESYLNHNSSPAVKNECGGANMEAYENVQ